MEKLIVTLTYVAIGISLGTIGKFVSENIRELIKDRRGGKHD